MTLQPSNKRAWAFDVIGRHHLDAPQKAKSKVASEVEDVGYGDLAARVVAKEPLENSVVVVIEK